MKLSLRAFFESRNFKMYETLWLLIVHILGVIGFFRYLRAEEFYTYTIVSTPYNKTFIILHCLSAIGVTGGAHRLWAHKSYSASLPLRVYLMLANSSCSQGCIWDWTRDHRLHHKFSDTKLDPHDSSKGFWHCHVGWILRQKSAEYCSARGLVDMSDIESDQVVMFQKRHYYKLSLILAFLVPALIGNLISADIWTNLLFLGFTKYIFFMNVTWCVNSVCHYWGTRTHNSNIEARDNIIISFLSLGEGWHNWHHEHPNDWKGSQNKWWMINLTYDFISLCSILGLADTTRVKLS